MKAAVLALALLAAVPALGCEVPEGLTALRGAVLDGLNAERRAAGLAALVADDRLDGAAQEQACRIAERGRLTHRGAWLAGLGRRLRRKGYVFAVAVENTALGQREPQAVVADWRASTGHRDNLLTPGAREAGIGIARADQGLAWVMIAAAPGDNR